MILALIQNIDPGSGFNILVVLLAAFGLNIAGIIGGVIAFTNRLTKIETAITAKETLQAVHHAHLREVGAQAVSRLEKDIGHLQAVTEKNTKDINNIGDLSRDVRQTVDTLVNLKK